MVGIYEFLSFRMTTALVEYNQNDSSQSFIKPNVEQNHNLAPEFDARKLEDIIQGY